MADPITLTAGAVIYHEGRVFRLMHATQVEPYRPSSAAIHIFPPHRPIQPDAGGAALETEQEAGHD